MSCLKANPDSARGEAAINAIEQISQIKIFQSTPKHAPTTPKSNQHQPDRMSVHSGGGGGLPSLRRH